MDHKMFYLKQEHFNSNLQLNLKDFSEATRFTDVTLVSDEKVSFEAHKFILAACSPMMKDLLLENPHPHPLIYMRGVDQDKLKSILDLMYIGKTKINYHEAEKFLKIVKEFQMTQQIEVPVKKEEISTKSSSKYIEEGGGLGRFERKTYSCDRCDYSTKTKVHLRTHQEAIHECITYSCNQCKYEASNSSNLRRHKYNIHDGIKYPCNQCDHKSRSYNGLKKHQKTVHEGVRYPCDKCDYKATRTDHLKAHVKAKHEGVKYFCDQCKFQSSWTEDLSRHKKSRHTKILN